MAWLALFISLFLAGISVAFHKYRNPASSDRVVPMPVFNESEVLSISTNINRTIREIEESVKSSATRQEASTSRQDELRTRISLAVNTHFTRQILSFLNDHAKEWGNSKGLHEFEDSVRRLSVAAPSEALFALNEAIAKMRRFNIAFPGFINKLETELSLHLKAEQSELETPRESAMEKAIRIRVGTALGPVNLEFERCQNLLKQKVRWAEFDATRMENNLGNMVENFHKDAEAHVDSVKSAEELFHRRHQCEEGAKAMRERLDKLIERQVEVTGSCGKEEATYHANAAARKVLADLRNNQLQDLRRQRTTANGELKRLRQQITSITNSTAVKKRSQRQNEELKEQTLHKQIDDVDCQRAKLLEELSVMKLVFEGHVEIDKYIKDLEEITKNW